MCWTRFSKTILDQDSGTYLLKTFLGHVFLDSRFENVTKFENRTATTPYGTIQKTQPQQHHHKENTAEAFTFTCSGGSCLSPTCFDSSVLLHICILFFACLVVAATPKNLSPHLLLFVTTGLPGVYVVHGDNALW